MILVGSRFVWPSSLHVPGGCPAHLRSDSGSQFTARQVKRFLEEMGVDTLFIEPGSPWENGYAESFNSRVHDELLDGELFLHLDEMRYVLERWGVDYSHYRPHSSVDYTTPAGFAELCREAGCIRPYPPVLNGVTCSPKTGPSEMRKMWQILILERTQSMKKKRFTEQQIAFALRQAEQGTAVEEITRKLWVSEATFCRWKKKFSGMGVAELRRLRQLAVDQQKMLGPGFCHKCFGSFNL